MEEEILECQKNLGSKNLTKLVICNTKMLFYFKYFDFEVDQKIDQSSPPNDPTEGNEGSEGSDGIDGIEGIDGKDGH